MRCSNSSGSGTRVWSFVFYLCYYGNFDNIGIWNL